MDGLPRLALTSPRWQTCRITSPVSRVHRRDHWGTRREVHRGLGGIRPSQIGRSPVPASSSAMTTRSSGDRRMRRWISSRRSGAATNAPVPALVAAQRAVDVRPHRVRLDANAHVPRHVRPELIARGDEGIELATRALDHEAHGVLRRPTRLSARSRTTAATEPGRPCGWRRERTRATARQRSRDLQPRASSKSSGRAWRGTPHGASVRIMMGTRGISARTSLPGVHQSGARGGGRRERICRIQHERPRKGVVVKRMEVRGLEPRTYCLQSNCSTR